MWGSVYILLGTIQRSYEPGIKLDEMLVHHRAAWHRQINALAPPATATPTDAL